MSDLALQVRALIAAGEGYQRAFAAAVGFGRTDVAALGHLYHGGPQTPTHLADRLHLTGSTVTGLADRMVTAGTSLVRAFQRTGAGFSLLSRRLAGG